VSEHPNHLLEWQKSYDKLAEAEEQRATILAELAEGMDRGHFDQDFAPANGGTPFAASLYRLVKVRERVNEQLKRLRKACISAQQRTGGSSAFGS